MVRSDHWPSLIINLACSVQALRHVYREADSGPSPRAQRCTEHGGSKSAASPSCAPCCDRQSGMQQGTTKWVNISPGIPLCFSILRLSAAFCGVMSTKSVCWLRYRAGAEHIQRDSKQIVFPSLCLSLGFSPSPRCQTAFSLTPAPPLSHISHCPHSFVFFFLPAPLWVNSSPPLHLFFPQLSEFLHSSLYPFLHTLREPISLSFSRPLGSLYPSILPSSSILASLVSSSTMPYLSHDIFHAFPPTLFVDLGSHLSLSPSRQLVFDTGHTLPPRFGFPEPPMLVCVCRLCPWTEVRRVSYSLKGLSSSCCCVYACVCVYI